MHTETRVVLEELEALRLKRQTLLEALNLLVDEDLIEATVYDLKAADCRLSYYLREAKRLQVKAPVNLHEKAPVGC